MMALGDKATANSGKTYIYECMLGDNVCYGQRTLFFKGCMCVYAEYDDLIDVKSRGSHVPLSFQYNGIERYGM